MMRREMMYDTDADDYEADAPCMTARGIAFGVPIAVVLWAILAGLVYVVHW
jgi:hypothetical protein